MIDSLLWSLIGPAYLPFAILILLLDIALCVTVVFLERKNPTVAIAWHWIFNKFR